MVERRVCLEGRVMKGVEECEELRRGVPTVALIVGRELKIETFVTARWTGPRYRQGPLTDRRGPDRRRTRRHTGCKRWRVYAAPAPDTQP